MGLGIYYLYRFQVELQTKWLVLYCVELFTDSDSHPNCRITEMELGSRSESGSVNVNKPYHRE